jgi:hexosaminidase
MKTTFAILIGLAAMMTTTAQDAPSLIPKPTKMIVNKGTHTLTQRTTVQYTDASLKSTASILGSGLGLNVSTVIGDTGIVLSIDESLEDLGKEGYALTVTPHTVTIKAPTATGVFYGTQTLRQLMPVNTFRRQHNVTGPIKMPCVEITDAPRFAWRGMLLDCCRHMFSVEFVKKYIDMMAMHKMNVFHWHLTEDQGWRIEIDAYPKLNTIGAYRKSGNGKYGGYHTKKEIREIVTYAKARHVTIVPEIEMPGHSVAALASYPHLGCTGGPYAVRQKWGVSKDLYCAGNDEVFVYLKKVLDEVVELFPGIYIHIGCDEAPTDRWKTCPKCQARMKKEGLKKEHELQIWFTQQIETYLQTKNRKVVGWADFLEGGPMKDTVVMIWRGGGRDGIKPAMKAINAGQKIIRTTGTYCYYDYNHKKISVEKVYEFEPTAEIPEDKDHMVLGSQGNLWTEHIRDGKRVEYMAYPRASALAEVLWATPEKDYDDFKKRLVVHYERLATYGINAKPFRDTIAKWTPDQITSDYAEVEWDVAKHLTKQGTYEIIFEFEKGKNGIEIQKVSLVSEGKVIAADTHNGFSGGRSKTNAYVLALPARNHEKLTLEAVVKGRGGTDSYGNITLRKR